MCSMTYRELVKRAQENCEKEGIPAQTAVFLLLELSEMESHNLYYEYENEVDESLLKRYEAAMERLLTQEPLQHILGYEWFYGYRFKVNEDVLIPRPETEELVANVLAEYDAFFSGKKVVACDVGCGSGAIAISLKKEEPSLTMYASDISEKALEVAKENAATLGAEVTFLCGDMLDPFIEKGIKVDVLVSNPPYIPKDEKMEKSVVDFEPHVALFGGDDGLYFYRKIFANAHQIIKEKAILAFEMGYNQKESMEAEAKKYFPNDRMETTKDLNGKNRMFFIYHNL